MRNYTHQTHKVYPPDAIRKGRVRVIGKTPDHNMRSLQIWMHPDELEELSINCAKASGRSKWRMAWRIIRSMTC